MAFRLTPSDTSFFDLLATAAQHGVEASRLLTDLLGARGEEALRITEQLRDVEAAADETTHEVVRKVNAAFITPFDHVDIVELAAAIDTCVDEIESPAGRCRPGRAGPAPRRRARSAPAWRR